MATNAGPKLLAFNAMDFEFVFIRVYSWFLTPRADCG